MSASSNKIVLLGVTAAAWMVAVAAQAQMALVPAYALAARAPIVVLGTVEKTRASEEPLLAAGDTTVVIKVERMYAGAEIAGDLSGQRATVILSRPDAAKLGERAVFYGAVRFIGKTVTIADVGETSPAGGGGPLAASEIALAAGVQARRDAPIRARLAIADAVFVGSVESVRALDPAEAKDAERFGEHDPELHLAMVRVKSNLRGAKAGMLVPVVFAASCDIMWCGAPKLTVGQEAVIAAHRPSRDEPAIVRAPPGDAALIDKAGALMVTAPYDTVAPSEFKRIEGLLQTREIQ